MGFCIRSFLMIYIRQNVFQLDSVYNKQNVPMQPSALVIVTATQLKIEYPDM